MLYTRKGDTGTTKTFGCDQRISKSSTIAEALGTVDEINSFLGLCKVKLKETDWALISGQLLMEIINEIQHNLFIIQAQLAGADKSLTEAKVIKLEKLVDSIEQELPPIKSFFVSGGSELATLFDFARTIARRAERKVVGVAEEKIVTLDQFTIPYLNRLSSLLYALARLSNVKSDITEESPTYM